MPGAYELYIRYLPESERGRITDELTRQRETADNARRLRDSLLLSQLRQIWRDEYGEAAEGQDSAE